MSQDIHTGEWDAEAAIARVLRAEQAAKADSAACREEAKNLVARAQAQARSIAARADTRIERLRARLRARTAAAVEALDAAPGAIGARDQSAAQSIDRAVRGFIAELMGGKG